jgi:hypothetical protein
MTDKFQEHLDRASAIVKTWPAWKQNVLGNSLRSTNYYSRGPTMKCKCGDNMVQMNTGSNIEIRWCMSCGRLLWTDGKVTADPTPIIVRTLESIADISSKWRAA